MHAAILLPRVPKQSLMGPRLDWVARLHSTIAMASRGAGMLTRAAEGCCGRALWPSSLRSRLSLAKQYLARLAPDGLAPCAGARCTYVYPLEMFLSK